MPVALAEAPLYLGISVAQDRTDKVSERFGRLQQLQRWYPSAVVRVMYSARPVANMGLGQHNSEFLFDYLYDLVVR
jgi:hypothetical protein